MSSALSLKVTLRALPADMTTLGDLLGFAGEQLENAPRFQDESPGLAPIDPDDERWDALLPDDDPYDPEPEPGDFWIDADEAAEFTRRRRQMLPVAN